MSDDEMPHVPPDEERLVFLDGAQNPYEWQPTISASWYATGRSLELESTTRAEVIRAFIVGYNEGGKDERLRGISPRPAPSGGAEH